MGEIEWAMWANEQAIISAFLMLIGGIIGVAGFFRYWQAAAYCIPASVLILLVEWPRGKRKKGNTIERTGQRFLTPVINKFGFLTKNYYIRFVGQLLMAVPACLLLPSIMGGICLAISAFIYLAAAIKGEEWKPVGLDTKSKYEQSANGKGISAPPTEPPPRAPKRDANLEAAATSDRY